MSSLRVASDLHSRVVMVDLSKVSTADLHNSSMVVVSKGTDSLLSSSMVVVSKGMVSHPSSNSSMVDLPSKAVGILLSKVDKVAGTPLNKVVAILLSRAAAGMVPLPLLATKRWDMMPPSSTTRSSSPEIKCCGAIFRTRYGSGTYGNGCELYEVHRYNVP